MSEDEAQEDEANSAAGTLPEQSDKQRKALIRREKRTTKGWLNAPEFSETQKQLMRKQIAKGLTDDEFAVFLYRARKFGLDPVVGELVPVVYSKDDPDKRTVVYITTRDGLLGVAHRSGMFGGIESGTIKKSDPEDGEWETYGWAKVWNKSFPRAVYSEVAFKEYQPPETEKSKKPLWWSKPKTMIAKVAEAHALRRAFSVSGVYVREEMDARKFIDGETVTEHTKNDIQAALAARARAGTKLEAKNEALTRESLDDDGRLQEGE